MTANLVNGYFNTLNVTNDNARIRLDIDGNIRMFGQKMFMNIVNGLDLRTDYSCNFTSLFGNLLMNAETGYIKIESGAIGTTSIYINNYNVNGGITLNSGLNGSTLTSTGLILIKSDGNDINIGYSDNDPSTNINETQNINLEAQYNISINSTDVQVVASETISFFANEINFGPPSGTGFLRILDDCLLIDSTSNIGLYKVLIDIDNSSISKDTYNGILIRSLNDDISADITIQSNEDVNGNNNNLSFGIEALNSINAIDEEYIAYKVDNKIIPLELSRDFSKDDIGKKIYWVDEDITEIITEFGTYITTPQSNSGYNLTTTGSYTGTQTRYYKIEIDSSTLTLNKFKWSNDAGITFQDEFVDVSGGPGVYLEDGISISFLQVSGYPVGLYWTFTVFYIPITGNSTTLSRPSQKCRLLKDNISYLTVLQPNDLQIKTSNQERLRITDNGNVGIGVKNPTSILEVKNKVGERILLSTDYLYNQINPSVAGLSNGGWVAVWESYQLDIGYNIYGQIFYPDGTRNGEQFQVNNNTTNNQSYPFVVATVKPNSGRFLVVWSSDETTIDLYEIKATIFDADLIEGSRKLYNDITISQNNAYSNKYPKATSLYNSDYPFIITWVGSNPADPTKTSIFFQVFGLNGCIYNSNQIINSSRTLSETYPDITAIDEKAAVAANGFIIAYMCDYSSDPFYNLYDIRYQIYNTNYTKNGSEVIISKAEDDINLYDNKTFGKVSIKALSGKIQGNQTQGGDFIVCYNRSYYGDCRKFIYSPPSSSDTLTGSNSGAIGYLKEIDINYPDLIKVQVLSGFFEIGEEFTTNFSNINERIENISYFGDLNNHFSLLQDEIEITLSRNIKAIQADKYNSSSTTLQYSITQVNTTNMIANSEDIFFTYYLPVITETYDQNFMICWSNGKTPNIYYQKFDSQTGEKLGNETILQTENGKAKSIQQINPAITSIKNKSNRDCGVVVVYSAETFDTSQYGVYGELINNDNPLMKISNGSSSFIFTNNSFLGIGNSFNTSSSTTSLLTYPESAIHIKNDNSNIILQNSVKEILGNGKSKSKINFKDFNSNDLCEIKGSYTTNYETRSPQFENLVRWYKFDEIRGNNYAIDNSKYNLRARLQNFNIYDCWVDGQINNALIFNSINKNYIDCGNETSLINVANGSFSISVWLKVFPNNVYQDSSYTIISTGRTDPGHFKLCLITTIYINSYQIIGTKYTISGEKTVGPFIITNNTWHNIVFTGDLTSNTRTLKLYYDGVLLDPSTSFTNAIQTPTDVNFYIGCLNTLSGQSDFFTGIMDDFRTYNQVLTGDDVKLLYNNGSLTKGKIVIKTNNGYGIPENDTVRNFTIDGDGFIENLKTRALCDSTMSGTLLITQSLTTIEGVLTSFLSEINPGDSLIIETYSRLILTVVDDLHLTINEAFPNSISGGYINVQRRPSMISGLDANSNVKLLLTAEGHLSIGYPNIDGKLVVSGDDIEDPTIYLKNYGTDSATNIIKFYGNNTGLSYPVAEINTSQTEGITGDGLLRFYLNTHKNDLDQLNQVFILNNLGYLGLANGNMTNPQAHLHIIDESVNDINILLESGSGNTAIGGSSSNIKFKSKNILNKEYSVIKGSSDSNIINSSKGRLDFLTNNGSVNVQRLAIKSNGGISFYLPNAIDDNTFHISPPDGLTFTGLISVISAGTIVTGSGTSFTNNYIGKIIYFMTDKISRVIIAVNNSQELIVSDSILTTLNSQSYFIYKSGINVNSNGLIGLGTSLQSSSVHLDGTLASGIIKISYADTSIGLDGIRGYDLIDKNYHTFLVDTTDGEVRMNLPLIENAKGRIYNIKKIAGTYNVVINGFSGQLIDAAAQYNLSVIYQSIIIQNDAINVWNVLSSVSTSQFDIASTDELPEGFNNLYFTPLRVKEALNDPINNITADDIIEGITNKYFNVSTLIEVLSITANNITSDNIIQGITNKYFNVSTLIETLSITANNITSDNIIEGLTNKYFTVSTLIETLSITANNITSDNIIEGLTNKYFTVSNLTEMLSITANNITTDNIVPGITNKYFDEITFRYFLDQLTTDDIVTGITNKYFDEITFRYFLDQLTTDDIIEGPTNKYFSSQTFYELLGLLTTDDLLQGSSNLYFSGSLVKTALGLTANNITTADLKEGGTYLYFTNERAIAAVGGHVGITSTDYLPEGSSNKYFSGSLVKTALGLTANNITTADLKEGGTYLYFTNERAIAAVGNVGITSTDFLPEGSSKKYFSGSLVKTALGITANNITTNDLEEGLSHLYFTEQRVLDTMVNIIYDVTTLQNDYNTLSSAFDTVGSAAGVSAALTIVINNLTTNDIDESGLTNLYFTNTRVASAISSSISTTDLTVSGNLSRTVSTITQLTSISTGITINSLNGLITTVQITLSALTADYFTVTNDKVSSGDLVFCQVNGKSGSPQSGLLVPTLSIYAVSNGSFNIILRNNDTTTDCTGVYDIAFQIIKKI